MLYRNFQFRLYPDKAQTESLLRWAGTCRFVYNKFLDIRRSSFRDDDASDRRKTWSMNVRRLNELAVTHPWISETPRACLDEAVTDQNRAFEVFRLGRAKHPLPRKRGVRDGMRFLSRDLKIEVINSKWSAVQLPGLSALRFRTSRPIAGKVLNAQVQNSASGWHVSFLCALSEDASGRAVDPLRSVGIDRGVTNPYVLSTGSIGVFPAAITKLERRKSTLQKTVSRRAKGSKRRERALARVRRLAERIKRIRTDWLHKATTQIAARFGTVYVERLDTRGMTASVPKFGNSKTFRMRKARLNHDILARAWKTFESMLAYKLAEREGKLVHVNPAYTSQTCSVCNKVDARSRKSQAEFECTGCGHHANADTNAALNIRRRGTASTMRMEGRSRSVEVRTHMGCKAPIRA